jgi:secreted PhoX family phosphatase
VNRTPVLGSLSYEGLALHDSGLLYYADENRPNANCLPDGADPDTLSDGCVRIATLNDLIANNNEGAEWTGGFWHATGSTFYVSVQHNMTGKGTILAFTGFTN